MSKKPQRGRVFVGVVMGVVFVVAIIGDYLSGVPFFPMITSAALVMCVVELINLDNRIPVFGSLAPDIQYPFLILAFISVWHFEMTYDDWPLRILAIIVPVVCQNVSAYYIGKKLLPKSRGWFKKLLRYRQFVNSPNKYLGVVIVSVLASLVFAVVLAAVGRYDFAVLAAIGAIFASPGDALESAAKRTARVKDSGELLREGNSIIAKFERSIASHGGMLDRFDSLSFCFAISLVASALMLKFG
jgi:CDP-diglyceride synthetase